VPAFDQHELDALVAAEPGARTVSAQLADRIVTSIALGAFVPGQRLPSERELAASLSLSRSTVRDALARVAALDLIEVRRGRYGGTFVGQAWGERSAEAVREILEPQWSALEQAMDMRHLVEALVARTAAERRTRTDTREISAALREYERADDLIQAQAADVRLHHAVAEATHNERLLALREQLLAEVSLGFGVEPFTQAIYDDALPQHQTLARAVLDGDAQAAWATGLEHFTITADEVRATLRRAVNTLLKPPSTLG
jgi:DNA-binding FadR family transcriptional regulator